tara:strand:- start:2913 stop:3065 length:153 start_codon:yes stop_codon:yes gene_type:complete
MEMLDRIIYKFCGFLDDSLSFVERYSVKFTSWLWSKRVKLLNKRRKKNAK